MFQSTPAIADGRTWKAARDQMFIKFQSTPAIADGRTIHPYRTAAGTGVSIHARHR